MVSASPVSKSENLGCQPSSVRRAWRVDRVPQVVPGAVHDVVVCVRGLAEGREDQLDDLLVVLLAVGADEIGLADLALLENRETAEEWSFAWIQSRTFSPLP